MALSNTILPVSAASMKNENILASLDESMHFFIYCIE